MSASRDDRVLPATRAVAALIVPFLLGAAAILYLWPDNTAELFAWTIAPRMTPLLMGAGYGAGAYFFIRAIFARRWHHVAVAFPPVTVFAAAMGIATLLHWDRFNHQHITFFTWAALYATTPFIVLGIWLLNRRADPGGPDPDDLVLPIAVRWLMGCFGAGALAFGLLFFVFPDPMIGFWPWRLTPLTARVVCGFVFALPGVFGLGAALDRRWSTARVALQGQMLWVTLTLFGVVRAWGDFDAANVVTWWFVAAMVVLLTSGAALYARMEIRRWTVRGAALP